MLQKYSIQQLDELTQLLTDLNDIEYSETMEDVFNSTIGKHTRHIIEFYETLCMGCENGILNYDGRQRQLIYEINRKAAVEQIQHLITQIQDIAEATEIILKLKVDGKESEMNTTAGRELLYLMEHTTHHIALIRIGLQHLNPSKNNFKTMGVAYSTPQGS